MTVDEAMDALMIVRVERDRLDISILKDGSVVINFMDYWIGCPTNWITSSGSGFPEAVAGLLEKLKTAHRIDYPTMSIDPKGGK